MLTLLCPHVLESHWVSTINVDGSYDESNMLMIKRE